jgi:hypothetical protein
MSRLTRLYPPRWRARYETEFDALLEAIPLGLSDRLDIVRGAFVAWLTPRYGYSMRRSRVWLALVVATTILFVSAAASARETPLAAQAQYQVYVDWGSGAYGAHPSTHPVLDLTIHNRGSAIQHMILALDFHRSARPVWHVASHPEGSATIFFRSTAVTVPGSSYAWSLGSVPHNASTRFRVALDVLRPHCTYTFFHVYAVVGHPGRRVLVQGGAMGGGCGMGGAP